MNPLRRSVLSLAIPLALVSAPLAAVEDCGPNTPPYLESGGFPLEGPLWAAAPVLEAADGSVDWSRAGPWVRALLEERSGDRRVPPMRRSGLGALQEMRAGRLVIESETGGRITYASGRDGSLLGPDEPDPGFREALLEAPAVVVASVVESCPGFLLDDVGSLLTLRTEEVLSRSGSWKIGREAYLFWPSAEFELGDHRFIRTHGGVPAEIAPGTRLLIVGAGSPLDDGGRLHLPSVIGVFRETDENGIAGAREVLPEGVSTFDEALAASRTVLATRADPGDEIDEADEESGPRVETRRGPSVGIRRPEASLRPGEGVLELEETVTGTLELRGWAAHAEHGVARLVAWLDGEPIHELERGLPEPGICERIPDPSCPRVGFSLSIDTTELSDGQHVVQVVAVENVASKPMPGFLKVIFRSRN